MGAISFSVDRAAVELVAGSLGLTTFVETGTFHGDSLANVRDLFASLHSAEVDPDLAAAAKARFHGDFGVTIHQGSSPNVLRDLHATPLGRVLYWLDAHWCESAGSDPTGQCPLLAEIDAIGVVGPNSVIAIDDARLFLAPPTAAHNITDWPHFDEVLTRLRTAAPNHRIVVLNDVIWAVPVTAFDVLLDYAARHGADWLAIAEKARTYDAVIAQLGEKDREIVALTAENQARLDLISRLNATLAQLPDDRSDDELTKQFENRLAALQAVAEERAQLIATLDAAARQATERAALAENARDRLRDETADKSRNYDAIIAQLGEKDREIASLTVENQSRSDLISRLNAALAQLQDDQSLDEATKQFENRLAALQAVAEERAQLIAKLDAAARQATERAALAENARDRLRDEAASAAALATEAAVRCDELSIQIRSLEDVARERGELIAILDAAARQAAERAGAAEEEKRHLTARIEALEATAADLTGQMVAATDRADALKQVAAERVALIERLDGIARATEQRVGALDELAHERAAALVTWQARALAAEQQLVDVTAAAADAASRAHNAERECDARQVVIDELVRARDAFSAALATGPRPTRLGRLFFRNNL
jgi:hypothetical protein